MSFGDVATKSGGGGAQQGDGGLGPLSDRLSLGVAARLSRYLQVLTQARKMGKETISSQELSEYTHVNSTQIRRDLSGFGKFGKRGVGYNVDSLVSQIRKILRSLTVKGGARDLMPAEYAYAVPRASLPSGSYAFRVRAWAPRQKRSDPTVQRSALLHR